MRFLKSLVLICAIGLTTTVGARHDSPEQKHRLTFDNIPVIILSGSQAEMGFNYGKAMKQELSEELTILKNFYITQKKLTYQSLLEEAEIFYNRFPLKTQLFLQNVAKGAQLPLADIKLLNAMELLRAVLARAESERDSLGQCAFLFLPPVLTEEHAALIGRNYDYPPPFDLLSKYLTITILKETDTIPTAMIAMAGQIYCPTCINAEGLFMELNNGMPSGGFTVDNERQTLLINMLSILQNSKTMTDVQKKMNATQSDFSLIVNTADVNTATSYEFSSVMGLKSFFPPIHKPFASTNFYQSPEWASTIPIPNDKDTWSGVSRRQNLLTLSAEKNMVMNVDGFKNLMDQPLKEGGAVWDFTIYQLIFDASDQSLYVKINHQGKDWTKIPLGQLLKG